MKLREVFDELSSESLIARHTLSDMDSNITGITFNSKEVQDGFIFVCKGVKFKVDYLKEAAQNGAVAYIGEESFEEDGVDLPAIVVTDVRHAMAILGILFYDNPSNKMNIVGITGTKGKTTTTHMMKSVLDEWAGHPNCGLISTTEIIDGKIRVDSMNTTPEALELQRWLHNMVGNGLDNCSLEVSSQALRYERTYGVNFKIGIFLNIGRDHISPREHKDFDDYFSAKLMLLDQSEICIINLDMDYLDEVIAHAEKHSPKYVTYSIENPEADFFAHDIRKTEKGLEFTVKSKYLPDFEAEFSIVMAGRFNVSNALSVIAAATLLGEPVDDIRRGLKDVRVEGRVEVFSSKDGKIVGIADYAHNKMSYETLISAMEEEYPEHSKNLYLIFGSVGEKAFERREELGTIAGQRAKKTYITSDEPGNEPFSKIADEIAEFVEAQGGEYTIIEKRTEAIEKAFADVEGPTLIMACGYGRLSFQKYGNEYLPIENDVDCIQRCLAEYDKKHQ